MKISVLCFLLLSASVSCFAQAPASPFDKWDADKDGQLSKSELPEGLRKNFERVDGDKDGFISRKEDADFRKNARGRKAGVPGVKKNEDLDYSGNGNPRQLLDLYFPESAAAADGKKLPLICWIHGGGWQNGKKDNARFVLDLVKTGKFAGASIGYRLTDEAQWPSQIHDCKAAIRWLKANADKYGYDADKIGVWGGSAGGHLVAMLGVSGDVASLEGTLGKHLDFDSKVACVVDYYGPTELLKISEHGKAAADEANSPESKLVGGPLQSTVEAATEASPMTHISKGDAPTVIFHGTKDPLVPFQQSVNFEKALEAAEVPATIVTIEGAGHGKGFPPEVVKLATQFLEHYLLGEGELPGDQTLEASK